MTHKPSHRRPTHRSQAGERADRARRTDEVLDRLDGLDASDAQAREALLQDLVEVNMPVARSIAARYRHRGISAEDLEQVAYLALVKVARTYDRASGHDFMSYAVPSIRGEVRRYFRDHGWMVRPPRRVQELQSRITAVESELTTRLGRPPSAAELAADLGEPEDDVREALAANGCFTPTSLDHVAHTAGSTSLSDQLGLEEGGFGAVEARVVLAPLVDGLTARERRILDLRFFRGCTQQEIADDIGVTQMQVSRLLSRLLSRLREDRRAEHPISA